MRRFFVKEIHGTEKAVLITGKELHHLRDVLRLKKGDEVIIFDGKGLEFTGKIEGLGKNEARFIIAKQLHPSKESAFEIILCQGLTKGEKMELIIQKATELGVSRIVPFVAQRVVPKLKNEQIAKKTQRWQHIAIEASKQCGRGIIPAIEAPATLTEVLSRWSMNKENYVKLIPWEVEKEHTLKDILKGNKPAGCIALIGPEGGFSEAEVNQAKEMGFMSVSLGPRILRAETAAISMVTIIQYELGDMGRRG